MSYGHSALGESRFLLFTNAMKGWEMFEHDPSQSQCAPACFIDKHLHIMRSLFEQIDLMSWRNRVVILDINYYIRREWFIVYLSTLKFIWGAINEMEIVQSQDDSAWTVNKTVQLLQQWTKQSLKTKFVVDPLIPTQRNSKMRVLRIIGCHQYSITIL